MYLFYLLRTQYCNLHEMKIKIKSLNVSTGDLTKKKKILLCIPK
jgi:hypothetical protein